MDNDLSEQLKGEKTERYREKSDLQDRLGAAEDELRRERNDQELADYLTERIKEGTTLLNQSVEDRDELPGWELGAAGWLVSVLAAMRHPRVHKPGDSACGITGTLPADSGPSHRSLDRHRKVEARRSVVACS